MALDGGGGNGGSGQSQAAAISQANMTARQAVLNSAQDMWLPIYQASLSGTVPGQVLNIPVRNVGLIKRFLVYITGSFAQGASETQTLTKNGLANLISNFTFTDLSNQQRINTTGLHMHLLACARRQAAFGAAFTNDSPVAVGSNFSVIKAPGTVTTAQPFSMYYEVPVSYGDFDLRGAIYANVVSATMNLQMTFNPNFSVGSTADPTLAGYQSSTGQAGVLSNVKITVYQNFLDQLPQVPGKGPVLPQLDLSYAYLLNWTSASGLVQAQDNPLPYANFRSFMSTLLVYDNSTAGGGLNAGTDINYFSLQTANYTNMWKLDPYTVQLLTREIMADDMPPGVYYFDHRKRPISTIQYGNMSLICNPNLVNTAASFLVGYESLAALNQITQAGSLYGT